MRIELVRQTGHPVPQFVVYAESDLEGWLLEMFVAYPRHSARPVKFHLHGMAITDGRPSSFNFGYVFDRDFAEVEASATRTDYRALTGHALDAYLAEYRPDVAPRCPEETDAELRERLRSQWKGGDIPTPPSIRMAPDPDDGA